MASCQRPWARRPRKSAMGAAAWWRRVGAVNARGRRRPFGWRSCPDDGRRSAARATPPAPGRPRPLDGITVSRPPPAEKPGVPNGKGGSPSPPGHRGGDPTLIPHRQQPAVPTPVTLLPSAPSAAQPGELTGGFGLRGGLGAYSAPKSPGNPDPPRYFLARRIRVNLVITVPASEVPEAADRQRDALPAGRGGCHM